MLTNKQLIYNKSQLNYPIFILELHFTTVQPICVGEALLFICFVYLLSFKCGNAFGQ